MKMIVRHCLRRSRLTDECSCEVVVVVDHSKPMRQTRFRVDVDESRRRRQKQSCFCVFELDFDFLLLLRIDFDSELELEEEEGTAEEEEEDEKSERRHWDSLISWWMSRLLLLSLKKKVQQQRRSLKNGRSRGRAEFFPKHGERNLFQLRSSLSTWERREGTSSWTWCRWKNRSCLAVVLLEFLVFERTMLDDHHQHNHNHHLAAPLPRVASFSSPRCWSERQTRCRG